MDRIQNNLAGYSQQFCWHEMTPSRPRSSQSSRTRHSLVTSIYCLLDILKFSLNLQCVWQGIEWH